MEALKAATTELKRNPEDPLRQRRVSIASAGWPTADITKKRASWGA